MILVPSVGMLIIETVAHQIPSGKSRMATLTRREFVKDSLPPLTAALTLGGLEPQLVAEERRERRKLPLSPSSTARGLTPTLLSGRSWKAGDFSLPFG